MNPEFDSSEPVMNPEFDSAELVKNPELDIPELVMNPEFDIPDSVMNPELVIEAEGVAEGDSWGSKWAARRRFVPKMPALRDPKQDVATQREKIMAPVGPKRREPKS